MNKSILNKDDEMKRDMISILNQLYLYAKICHCNPKDYEEVIDGLRNKYPELKTKLTGVL